MFRRLSEQAFESCSRVYAPGNQKKKEKSGTAFNHCQIFHAQKYEILYLGRKLFYDTAAVLLCTRTTNCRIERVYIRCWAFGFRARTAP